MNYALLLLPFLFGHWLQDTWLRSRRFHDTRLRWRLTTCEDWTKNNALNKRKNTKQIAMVHLITRQNIHIRSNDKQKLYLQANQKISRPSLAKNGTLTVLL